MATRHTPIQLECGAVLACTIPPLSQPELHGRPFNHGAHADHRITYLYAISRRDVKEIKIGISIEPWSRLRDFQSAHGSPLELALALPCLPALEIETHQRFATARKIGEWFEQTAEITEWVDATAATIPSLPDISPLVFNSIAKMCEVRTRSATACVRPATNIVLGKWMCRNHMQQCGNQPATSVQDYFMAGGAP